MKKRSNMRDVAQYAGVSVATVSRVMSAAQTVSPATRARVESAIEALDFVPSAAARAINSGRSNLVGALVPTLGHAIFTRFLDAIELELSHSGLSLVVATTENDPDREADRARHLLNLGVEGLVVSGVSHSSEFTALLRRHKVPVIATSYYDPAADMPTIGYANNAVAQLALNHLLELGHHNIAVLSGPSHNNDRTRARLSALTAMGCGHLHICELPLGAPAASDWALGLRDRFAHVTAVLCLSDVLAHGVLFQCQRMGISVPGEMSVMGIDDLPISALTCPALSSVHLPVGQMGQAAAKALAHWVETGNSATPERLEARLVVRESTGVARDPT